MQTGYGSSDVALFSIYRVHKTLHPIRRVVSVQGRSGQYFFYRSKLCSQNVISGRSLKLRLLIEVKMHLNDIEDYGKLVTRMRYGIRRLHE